MDDRIVFLGGGNMATALIEGLMRHGHPASRIAVVDVADAVRARHAAAGIEVHATPGGALGPASLWVLAVKPQGMAQACAMAAPFMPRGATVVSIAAGVTLAALADALGDGVAIVRAMPNTPATVGLGMTGLYAVASVAAHHRERASALFGAVGTSLWLRDEAMMDAITAIGGSGPGYVYYFMEAVEATARQLGFDDGEARRLAVAVFRGAAELAQRDPAPLDTLRARVASKGGTTEAAIASLQDAGVGAAIQAALERARSRARELALGGA